MVRNLMLIFGLSLALASFGCSSSDDNGGGGEGGGSVTPTDACLDSADLAMVCMPDFGDTYVGPCATTALGQGPGTSTCLQEDPPALSAACADCYGDITQCVYDNCVGGTLDGPCAPPNASDSEGCLSCRDEAGCDTDGAVCTGDLVTACAG